MRALRPDAYPPVFFAVALVATVLSPTRAAPIAIAWVAAALFPVLSFLSPPARHWRGPILMTALGCAIGLVLAVSPEHRPFSTALQTGATASVVLEGVLVEDAALSAEGGARYRVRVRWVSADAANTSAVGIATIIARRGEEFAAGRVIRAVVPADRLPAAGLPGDAPSAGFIRADSVEAVGWAAPRYELRARVRAALFDRIDGMGYRAGGLFRALTTGSRAQLSRAQQASFRESGSSHLLALSGMHLGIIAAVVFAATRVLWGNRVAFLITLVAAVGYVALVGARPSLLRALTMFAVGGGIALAYRSTEPINVLAVAVALPVIVTPHLAGELSFQLSVFSLVGIIAIAPLVYRRLVRRVPRLLAAPLSAAFGAQLATAPLTLGVFGVVHPVAVLSSLLLVPMVTLFVWSGLVWLSASLIMPLGANAYTGTAYTGAASALESGFGVPALLLALLREQASLIHHTASFFAEVPALLASPLVWGAVMLALAVCVVDGLDWFRWGDG